MVTLKEIKRKEEEFDLRGELIGKSLEFYKNQAEKISAEIEKLDKQSFLPDWENKRDELVRCILNISEKADYEGKQLEQLGEDIGIFRICVANNISVKFNPKKFKI